MKALLFRETGEPRKVLRLEEIGEKEPGSDEVSLRVFFSPVNPSDLQMVRGRYGYQPNLPASPGAEGVAIVIAVGSGVTDIRAGDRVICFGTWNLWRERVICKAAHVVRVPAAIGDEAAATCYQNPLAAWALTQSVRRLGPGDWLLQTAAASSVGKLVLQLSKVYGFRTINVVRRRVEAEVIRVLGGDEIICTEDEDLRGRIQELTHGRGLEYAIDCVAGDVGGEVARNLAPTGEMVQFGALSSHRQTDPAKFFMPIFSPKLIYSAATIRGWWIPLWLDTQPVGAVNAVLTQLLEMVADGRLTLPETISVPVDKYKDAMAMADDGSAEGKKVLLQFALVGALVPRRAAAMPLTNV
jgi:NADPH2:quinone reductase